MKIRKTILIVVILFVAPGCVPSLYSKKELRTQSIPAALQNRTWILREIHSEKILDESTTTQFNDANGTTDCVFSFQFADEGELIMSFKEYKFKGIYLVNGNKFKLVYSGFREKIVWTGNPECKITPTQLGYVFNWREFDYKIEGRELTLESKTGDRLLLTTDSD